MSSPIRFAIVAAATLMPMSAYAMSQPPQSPPKQSGPQTGGGGAGHAPSGSPASVPEPGMFALFATGLAGAYAGRKLSKRRKKD